MICCYVSLAALLTFAKKCIRFLTATKIIVLYTAIFPLSRTHSNADWVQLSTIRSVLLVVLHLYSVVQYRVSLNHSAMQDTDGEVEGFRASTCTHARPSTRSDFQIIIPFR